jgi:demethylmenaquinone methyltransferase/2-methoxy-6-polyprenyl-1,4-benzoquinol methylase
VTNLGVRGRVLELACGTGMWTRELAQRGHVTAIDTAPETLAIAARRCSPGVQFEVGNVFDWQASGRFDLVFFACWPSHVPGDRTAEFFDRVRSRLAPDGRAVFVDEPARVSGKERMDAADVALRTLTDGSSYRIVKRYIDPARLTRELARLGWRSEVAERGDWIVGQAWPR